VGANIGKYVEELKLLPVARSCEILAFEPNPDVFAILERRVRSLTKVFVNNKGVADKPGNLTSTTSLTRLTPEEASTLTIATKSCKARAG